MTANGLSPQHHEPVPDVFAPAKLGPLTLRNRIIKAATYENMARNSLVTDELIDFHVQHAAGGAAMTTVAYCAVSPEGRTDGHQIVWREEAKDGLRKLTDAVHAQGAAVSAQVGHSGPVGDEGKTGGAALSPSRYRSKQSFKVAREITEPGMERVIDAYRNAVRTAIDTGFDALEIHLGHNYLASAFLSPLINRRTDEYGGPLENRARFPLAVLRAVRDEAGDRLALIGKLGMEDGVKGGFEVEEAAQVAQWIERDGTLDALELTAGSSLLNPMYLFRGDSPIDDFAAVMPQPIKLGVKLVGKRFLKEYPYEEAFLLPQARVVRDAVEMPLVLLGGVTQYDTMQRAMREGFQFVAMGRALLREPDLINGMVADRSRRSRCDHNNRCMVTIFDKTRCVLVPEGSQER